MRHPPLILGSSSPRRRELLTGLGLSFQTTAADIDETPRPDEAPRPYVERMAREKAAAIAQRHPQGLVLAADTAVVLGEEILGKPRDAADARAMLGKLAGRAHRVMTAVALDGVHRRGLLVETEVEFRPLTPEEIAWYVESGEPLDKSGSYALQGKGAFLVRRIAGSSSNVVGLPLAETIALLREAGVGFAWELT